LPGDELIFATQKACQALLAEHGYAQYEISAYSRSGRQCRHNLNYWQFGDYLGIGAGAHGKISLELPGNIVRTCKPRGPEQYLQDAHRRDGAQTIAERELPLEFVMNHLRLKQGFTLDTFTAATGLAPAALEPGLSVNCRQHLLTRRNAHYFCSEKGWDFLDTVLQNFIA
jgi:coproporphyrinogen III oxidase-like Fe-S oxidoreductase